MNMNVKKPNQDIRDRMEKSGLTQYAVAARMGKSYSTINIWLRLPLPPMDPRRVAIMSTISMMEKEGAAHGEEEEVDSPTV